MTTRTTPHVLLLDVDGTIVDYDTSVPGSAADSLRRAKANGHRLFICTGRAKAEVYPHLWELGLDGMIGGNGSYVEVDGHVVHHQVLDQSLVEQAIAWLEERDLPFYLECNSGLFGSPDLPERAARRLGRSPEWVRSIFPAMVYDTSRGHYDVNKISFLMADGMSLVDLLPDLQERFDGRASVGSWSANTEPDQFGEIGQLGISKEIGVRALAEHLGARTEELIGFGDARSDIPMLRACGTAVVMGQAPDEVKALADLVTAPVDHDGLAKAFAELGLV
ncbi:MULTISPECIES: HAD family hydrolase [unclassified Luteococcus]|uniref:HAD family hydrolase n=1 Tax=unclassified Luteococcus TaxID=2639923 RepID=UPI00313E6142